MINRQAKLLQAKESAPSDTEEVWHAQRGGYVLDQSSLRARLVLVGDSPGLRDVSPVFGSAIPRPAPILLALDTVAASSGRAYSVRARSRLNERRRRRAVVDAVFEPSSRCPVRLHGYWKAGGQRQFDLEVLANAADPIEQVEVLTLSQSAAAELLIPVSQQGTQWIDAREAGDMGFRWLVLARDRDAARMSLDGRHPPPEGAALGGFYRHPLTLFRPTGARWSYLEMSHPEDCVRIMVHAERPLAQVSFGLFGLDIEKGVILRGRVRAMFIDRAQDTRQALRAFHRFAQESPRLSV